MIEPKPKTIEEALADLEAKRDQGILSVEVDHATELVKTILAEAAQLMNFVLFNTPKAENYLSFTFVNDDHPEYDFEVILHKKGKKYPTV